MRLFQIIIIYSFVLIMNKEGKCQVTPEFGIGLPNQLMSGFNYISKDSVKRGVLLYGRLRLSKEKNRYDFFGGVPRPGKGFLFQNGLGVILYKEWEDKKKEDRIWRSSFEIAYLESGLNYRFYDSPGLSTAPYSEFFDDYFNISCLFGRSKNSHSKFIFEFGPILQFVNRHYVREGTYSQNHSVDEYEKLLRLSVVLKLAYYFSFEKQE